MNGSLHFNPATRHVVLVDRQGLVWRVIAAGPVMPRRARIFYEFKPIGPGLFEIGFATKRRRIRLERTDDTPDGPPWSALAPTQAAAKLVGFAPRRGAELLKRAVRAGRTLFEIGSAAVSAAVAVKRFLEPTNNSGPTRF